MLSLIKKHRFMALLRHVPENRAEGVLTALYKGGIRLIEITFNPSDPGTVEKTGALFHTAQRLFGGEVSLAAGTVVKPAFVTAAKQFGAGCIVSPHTDAEIIRMTKEAGMVSIPGALTPTEIMTAYNLGADLVKIFPIMPGDIPYLKNILAPLSHIPFITTGGVNPETAGTFIKMGAVALAAGATIITPDALAKEDYETITENAHAHLAAIRKAAEEMK